MVDTQQGKSVSLGVLVIELLTIELRGVATAADFWGTALPHLELASGKDPNNRHCKDRHGHTWRLMPREARKPSSLRQIQIQPESIKIAHWGADWVFDSVRVNLQVPAKPFSRIGLKVQV